MGSAGLIGGLAAYMLIVANAAAPDNIVEFAAARQTLALVSKYLIVPSLMAVLLSGVLSMAVHHPFHNAGWVWAKLLIGFLILESSLATIDAPARDAAAASARALAGEIDLATMATQVQDRWGAWWVLLALFAGNVAMAIWRPRFVRPTRESA